MVMYDNQLEIKGNKSNPSLVASNLRHGFRFKPSVRNEKFHQIVLLRFYFSRKIKKIHTLVPSYGILFEEVSLSWRYDTFVS